MNCHINMDRTYIDKVTKTMAHLQSSVCGFICVPDNRHQSDSIRLRTSLSLDLYSFVSLRSRKLQRDTDTLGNDMVGAQDCVPALLVLPAPSSDMQHKLAVSNQKLFHNCGIRKAVQRLIFVILLEGGPGVEGGGYLRDGEGGLAAVVEDFDEDFGGAAGTVED